jgi:hypothetical protein
MQDKKNNHFSDLKKIQAIEDYSLIAANLLEMCVNKLFEYKYKFLQINQAD